MFTIYEYKAVFDACFFNSIVYFDTIFGLGIASISEENNTNEFTTNGLDNSKQNETHTGAIWDIGARFYLSQHWSSRLDFTGLLYKAKQASGNSVDQSSSYYTHYDLTLSFAYAF